MAKTKIELIQEIARLKEENERLKQEVEAMNISYGKLLQRYHSEQTYPTVTDVKNYEPDKFKFHV